MTISSLPVGIGSRARHARHARRINSRATNTKSAYADYLNPTQSPKGDFVVVAREFIRRAWRARLPTCIKPGTTSLLIALLAAFLSINYAHAQGTTDTTWTRLGTLPSGTISLAQDTAATSIYALNAEGIQKSDDGGKTWELCNREARAMRLVNPLPGGNGPTLLYASTPGGLRVSEDACRTWRDVPTQGVMPSGAHIRWLATYPNNLGVLYAGMDGLGGLYRSTDAGANWQPASGGLPSGAWVTALTADPTRPEHVIVGLKYTGRNHSPAYVYASHDGGLTWRSSSLGTHILPNNGGRVVSFAWSGNTLLAATAYDGLYASDDQGKSWRRATLPRRTEVVQRPNLSGTAPIEELPIEISALAATPEGALIINTKEGAFQSLDGARSWTKFGPKEARVGNPLMASDAGSGRVLLAGAGGVWSYKLPAIEVSLPTATPQAIAALPPTPPPAPDIPTTTPVPPTATALPSPTPTIVLVEGPLPTDRVGAGDPAVSSYFEQTGHNIKYGFRDFWLSAGGLAVYGYPLTEEFVEGGVSVQYFERARLEYRDGKITLGRVGAELTEGQFFRGVAFFPSESDNAYFPTGHSVSGPFLRYWRELGGEAVLGLPLSESFKDDGSEYQWFERGRLEWHPALPEGKKIALGNVGTETLRRRGWIR